MKICNKIFKKEYSNYIFLLILLIAFILTIFIGMNSSTNSISSSQLEQFTRILTLVEYCIVTIVYTISLLFFLRILFSLYKRVKRITFQDRNGISNLLIANLICWSILLASGLPHNLWMLGNWRPTTRYVSSYFMFWSTILTQCMMSVIPFSIFFLSLDRTFSIQWLISYGEWHKLILLGICLISICAIFIVNFFAYIQIMPLPEETSCIVFACLMTNGNNVFIASKLIGGLLIISSGSYFLYKLRKRRSNIQSSTSMYGNERSNKIDANTLVVLMLATEICLNFIPQLLVLIIQNWIVHHSIASYLGPHNLSLNCLEGLITSLIYRHTLRRFINANNTSSAAAAQQQISNHALANRGSIMAHNFPNATRGRQLQEQRGSSTLFTMTN